MTIETDAVQIKLKAAKTKAQLGTLKEEDSLPKSQQELMHLRVP